MNNRVTHFSMNQLFIYTEELLLDSAEKRQCELYSINTPEIKEEVQKVFFF